MIKKIPLLILASTLLVACNNDDNDTVGDGTQGKLDAPTTETVYILSQAVACESDGLSAAETAQVLLDAGIDVTASECGRKLDAGFNPQCGEETTAINLHDIPVANVEDAEALGYGLASTLTDSVIGPGYVFVDCPTI